jgi:CheY-like chemotaxis protein
VATRNHPLARLARDFDALFGVLGGSSGGLDADLGALRVWDFDVAEDQKEVIVRAEVPGFEEKEIDLQIDRDTLTIRAQKEQKGDGREEYRGEAALRLAEIDPPDVVLLDLSMPGINGWELAHGLLDMKVGKCPLSVAVSGYADEEARRRSADAGIDLHLVKPVHPAVLVGVLKRFARANGPGPDTGRDRSSPPPATPGNEWQTGRCY